ncbi:MAG: hypothetical protein ACT4PW_09790 [Acidimicrobiia bacterium]
MAADPRRLLHLAAVAVGLVWLPVYVLWGPAVFALTFDDAYYYFQIARNVADGQGSTFNGLDPTNGYHPLWLVVCAAPFAVGLVGLTAVRALLVLQLAVYVAALWVLAGVVGDAVDRWPRLRGEDRAPASRRASSTLAALLFLAAGNPFVLKLFVNGLESGLVALATALLLAASVRRRGLLLGGERRDRLVFGALLAFAFLARTDAVLLIGAAGLWCLADVVAGRGHRRRRVTALVETFALPTFVLVGYLAFNVAVFGHALQISGVVKRLPFTAGRLVAVLVAVAVAAAVGAGGRHLRAAAGEGRFARTATFVGATGWFAAGLVMLLAYDRVLSAETYLWYYGALGFYLVAVMLHAAADLLEGAVVEARSGRTALEALRPVQAILALPFFAGVALTGRAMLDPELRSLQRGDRAAAEWVRDNTPEGTVVASWDAGVVGFFVDRPVVNLDGVVNSFEWRDARRRGPEHARAFLAERGVSLVVNHGLLRDGEDPELAAAVDRLLGRGRNAGLRQLHRVEYVFSGTAGGVSGRRPYGTFVYELPL